MFYLLFNYFFHISTDSSGYIILLNGLIVFRSDVHGAEMFKRSLSQMKLIAGKIGFNGRKFRICTLLFHRQIFETA